MAPPSRLIRAHSLQLLKELDLSALLPMHKRMNRACSFTTRLTFPTRLKVTPPWKCRFLFTRPPNVTACRLCYPFPLSPNLTPQPPRLPPSDDRLCIRMAVPGVSLLKLSLLEIGFRLLLIRSKLPIPQCLMFTVVQLLMEHRPTLS